MGPTLFLGPAWMNKKINCVTKMCDDDTQALHPSSCCWLLQTMKSDKSFSMIFHKMQDKLLKY
jgi:hypothetical protein